MTLLVWILLLLAVAIASFLAGICAVLWWAVPRLERGFLFSPNPIVPKTPDEVGLPFEQHFIDTPDGCRLSAWHMCPPDPLGAVVYFHGRATNMGILNEIFALIYKSGLQLMAVDYRGFGWSSGTPSEAGLYIDAKASVKYFRENLKAPHVPLIYWGRSMGGCFAAYAARQHPPHGLILETAFTSKSSLIKHYPRLRFLNLFSRCRLNTIEHLKNHPYPVLLMHGDLDKTVPLAEGHTLYERLSGPKEFFRVEGADHINIHLVDSEAYIDRVLKFISQARPPMIH